MRSDLEGRSRPGTRVPGVLRTAVFFVVLTGFAGALAGCATTQSVQTRDLIAGSKDPKYTEALVAQLTEAGADDAILQERFALDARLESGQIGQREYETEMGKLQVRMDTNRAKREKQARDRRALLSVVQGVAGAALSAVL